MLSANIIVESLWAAHSQSYTNIVNEYLYCSLHPRKRLRRLYHQRQIFQKHQPGNPGYLKLKKLKLQNLNPRLPPRYRNHQVLEKWSARGFEHSIIRVPCPKLKLLQKLVLQLPGVRPMMRDLSTSTSKKLLNRIWNLVYTRCLRKVLWLI